MADEASTYKPRCQNLYCKSMLVYGESFEMDPEYQAGLTEFWCLCTSRNQGPDLEEVSLERCSDSQRTCFKEY
jgi:hypothetical protein